MKEFILPDRGLAQAIGQASAANAYLSTLKALQTDTDGAVAIDNQTTGGHSSESTLVETGEKNSDISCVQMLLLMIGGYLIYKGIIGAIENEEKKLKS